MNILPLKKILNPRKLFVEENLPKIKDEENILLPYKVPVKKIAFSFI